MVGAEGFRIASLNFRPEVGRGYRIEMQPPEGDAFQLIGEFREVEPPARLAFTFSLGGTGPDDVETLAAPQVPGPATQPRSP